MLRLLFQALEQSLGPWLAPTASVVYWAGLALLAIALVSPLLQRWMEHATDKVGIDRQWVMTCASCQQQTIVSASSTCGYCDEPLQIPGAVKWWTGATGRRPSVASRRRRWMIQLAGSALLLPSAVWLVAGVGALGPQGPLQQLFLGFGLLALAGMAWLGARAVSLSAKSMLTRARDGLLALAAMGVMTLSFVLAGQAIAEHVTVLARFATEHGAARVGKTEVRLVGREIGFEYLRLDHDVLGYHTIVPLAFLGRDRVPVSRCPLLKPILSHLQAHPDAYAERGLIVRLRTDRHRVLPGRSYEIIRKGNQVLIRLANRSKS